MVSNDIGKEFWWIRTPSAGLTIGQLCLDSEGSTYFIDVRDPERVYDGDDVAPVVRTQRPADINAINGPSGLPEDPDNQIYCGSRALSFKGWTTFRCGKCAACRVSGSVNRTAKSKILRGTKSKI